MDQDGTEELILTEGLANGPFIYYAYRVYTAEKYRFRLSAKSYRRKWNFPGSGNPAGGAWSVFITGFQPGNGI